MIALFDNLDALMQLLPSNEDRIARLVAGVEEEYIATDVDSMFPDIHKVRSSFRLLRANRLPGQLARFQDLPGDVFFGDSEEVKAIIFVSHKWMRAGAPDPDNRKRDALNRFFAELDQELNAPSAASHESTRYIAEHLVERGISLSEVGVWFDFSCLHQRKNGSREWDSDADRVSIKKALKLLPGFIFFEGLIILQLRSPNDGYDTSGWCQIESESDCAIVKAYPIHPSHVVEQPEISNLPRTRFTLCSANGGKECTATFMEDQRELNVVRRAARELLLGLLKNIGSICFPCSVAETMEAICEPTSPRNFFTVTNKVDRVYLGIIIILFACVHDNDYVSELRIAAGRCLGNRPCWMRIFQASSSLAHLGDVAFTFHRKIEVQDDDRTCRACSAREAKIGEKLVVA